MKKVSLEQELKGNAYPGRGIVIGRSKDGTKAVAGYFIMGRSQNSRNRVFVEEGEGIRTQAFDPSKLEDPSLIIYAPVRVLGNDTIVTNGDQTDTVYEGLGQGKTFEVGHEIIVTKNGHEVGRFIPKDAAVSYLTDSLTGILQDNGNLDEIKTESMREKYGFVD